MNGTAYTRGHRVGLADDGALYLCEGEYGRDRHGHWHVRPPGAHVMDVEDDEITEHDDGTITVHAELLYTIWHNDCAVLWHGRLTRGFWVKG